MDGKDLYWLAGLLEGEGSFLQAPPSEPTRPRISIEMTDVDIILKVNRLFGLKYYLKNANQAHENWKPSFRTVFRGKRANETMRLLYPLMGSRRQKQIENAIHEKSEPYHDASDPNWFYWLIGLLEGEGSFQKSAPSKQNLPKIQLNMTDHDVILRAALLMGVKVYGPYHSLQTDKSYKPRYIASMQGKRAVDFMKKCFPHLSLRRQSQIESVLASYQPAGQVRGEKHPQSKLNETQVREIKRRLECGDKLKLLATEFGVDTSLIWQIKAKKLWQHLE